MPKVISFDDALKDAGGKDCSLLLGNGFSSRYFSYRSLLDKADLKPEDPVRVLFDRLKTVDFERVVKALEGAREVEMAYGNKDHAEQLIKDFGPSSRGTGARDSRHSSSSSGRNRGCDPQLRRISLLFRTGLHTQLRFAFSTGSASLMRRT